MEPVQLVGPEGVCPENFAACLEAPEAAKLANYLGRSRRWAMEAWFRCGPPAFADAGVK